MDLLHSLTQRRTVRRFKPEPLREGDLERLLEAARRAPTDASAQLYSILRVTDPELRRELARLASGQAQVTDAAEFFVPLADVHRLERLLAHRGQAMARWPRTGLHFALVDATLAGAHLAAAAEALGYGICWIGGLLNHPREVARLLELPPGVVPVSGLAVGVPDEDPPLRPRLPEALVVHEDRYRAYTPADLDAAYEAMAPASRRGDWLFVLERYFAAGGAMEDRDPDYGRLLARQGFVADWPPEAARALDEAGTPAGSLGEALEAVLGSGWRGVLFGREGEGYRVWLERETAAERGEGASPGEALARAVPRAD
ncbi:nitroreductase family protein [Oceanithermus sp.]|uniref:nitroreductase family protein n=1 Tax=Oceanithermus sp. TaxID=2268145 RepID=UPI0025F7B448|nr:nitroreductase family protein [Oceanithermus sp.]